MSQHDDNSKREQPGAWKLDELAERADLSPRTVRYYLQRGLLPPPVFHGRDTTYGAEHLLRLRAIRLLQAHFLPLDAIAAQLDGRTPAEVERVLMGLNMPPVMAEMPAIPPPVVARSRRWQRIEVAPGLELNLADDASPAVKRLAQRWLEQAAEGLDQAAKPHNNGGNHGV